MNKISVIIATYNGEAFIEEQLESIRLQSYPIDEVLIADDCSSDRTVEIVRKFIKKYGLKHWILQVNKRNLGWEHNFINLIFRASGDIIFYCDQDDIWLMDKIKIMVTAINRNEKILCLSSRYLPIDADENILNGKNKKNHETGKVSKVSINDRKFFYVPLGCTLAFRRELLKYMDKDFYFCGADRIIVRTAILIDGMYDIDLILIKHRFHYFNASHSLKELKYLHGSSTLLDRIKYVQEDILQLKNLIKKSIDHQFYIIPQYKDMLEVEEKRLMLLKNKNILLLMSMLIKSIGKEWFPYIRIILIADFLYAVRLNHAVSKIIYLYCRIFK